MPNMLILGRGGSINRDRVLAVASVKSAPVVRVLDAATEDRVLNLTYGYPRQSVILLDNGTYVVSHRTPEELTRAIHLREDLDHADTPWW